MSYEPPKVSFEKREGDYVSLHIYGDSARAYVSIAGATAYGVPHVHAAVIRAGKHPSEALEEAQRLLSEAWDAYHEPPVEPGESLEALFQYLATPGNLAVDDSRDVIFMRDGRLYYVATLHGRATPLDLDDVDLPWKPVRL